jgi:hypothetical protein
MNKLFTLSNSGSIFVRYKEVTEKGGKDKLLLTITGSQVLVNHKHAELIKKLKTPIEKLTNLRIKINS